MPAFLLFAITWAGLAPEQALERAVGGLVGYDFGRINVQMKLTTDVYEKNYNGKDTRMWANVVIPLWNPAPASKPVVAKF